MAADATSLVFNRARDIATTSRGPVAFVRRPGIRPSLPGLPLSCACAMPRRCARR